MNVRILRIFAAAAIVAAALCASARAMDEKGFPGNFKDYDYVRVAGVMGQAWIERGGYRAALPNKTELGIGDIISTGGDGVVVINYMTDGYLVLWPSSKINIQFAGATTRREKALYYSQTEGKVYNRMGGSYFGASDVNVLLPGITVVAKSADFCTMVGGGASVSVRSGSLNVEGGGFKKEVGEGRRMDFSGGAANASNTPQDQLTEFLTAGQYMVMAQRGDPLRNPVMGTSYVPQAQPSKPYISDVDNQHAFAPAYANNEIQASEYGAPGYIKGQQINGQSPASTMTTSDKVMGGELPYFPADRMGDARNPDKDYRKTTPPPVKNPIVPGEVTDSELWPELFPEDDAYLKNNEPDYPFPEDYAKSQPLPQQRKDAKSMRAVAPPPIDAVTARSENNPKADFKGAYSMCQNYGSTQSEVDDCIAQHLKPEAMPGAIKYPDPPPELNLPMSHEPQVPEYVSLPPVSELPAPTPGVAQPQLPTCRYTVLQDYSLTHNDNAVDLLTQGRYASALESFESALRMNPENADILNNIAITYLKMGDPQKGERFMKRAVSAEPGRKDIHTNMGCIMFSQGKSLQACSEWTMVLNQDANYKDASYNQLNFCRQ